MATLTSLKVDIDLQTAQFERRAAGVKDSVNRIGKEASKASGYMRALVGAVAAAGFSQLVKNSLDAANRLGDLSTRLGTTVEGLSRLEYAAKLTGVSSTTLATGLQRMTRRVAEAANGTGEAVKALNELGLSASKLNQLRPEQQFEVLADALEKVPSQSDKVRLSMKLLDSEGVSLLQTMSGGSEAIRKMGEESDRTGNTISTQFAAQATAANAAINKLGGATTGLINSLVAGLGPTLEQVATFLGDVTPKAGQLAADALTKLRQYVVEIASSISGFLEGVAGTAGVIAEKFGASDISESLFNTAESYRKLKGDLGDLGKVYEEGAGAVQKFNVETKNNVVNFSDYLGKAKDVADATKRATEAIKARAAAEKELNDINKSFNSVRESLLSEEQAERESYLRRMQQIGEFAALKQENEAAANVVAMQEYQRHQLALTSIEEKATAQREKLAEQERRAKIAVASGMFGNLSALMNTESKKLFNIGKTAAIANAVVSGFEAVVHSYKEGAKIGGPVLGATFAATAAAATAAQIQNIRSQQFGGGGTVTAGTAGGAGPGVYQPPQPAIPTGPDSGQGRGVQIIFNGNVGNIDDAERLAELLADYVETSDAIIVSDTSRNGQLLRAS